MDEGHCRMHRKEVTGGEDLVSGASASGLGPAGESLQAGVCSLPLCDTTQLQWLLGTAPVLVTESRERKSASESYGALEFGWRGVIMYLDEHSVLLSFFFFCLIIKWARLHTQAQWVYASGHLLMTGGTFRVRILNVLIHAYLTNLYQPQSKELDATHVPWCFFFSNHSGGNWERKLKFNLPHRLFKFQL